jgi:hypothetical protein
LVFLDDFNVLPAVEHFLVIILPLTDLLGVDGLRPRFVAVAILFIFLSLT